VKVPQLREKRICIKWQNPTEPSLTLEFNFKK
jgi:hypothetical protein